eukprot:365742-Chlamydomonas_euryale.AAC.7
MPNPYGSPDPAAVRSGGRGLASAAAGLLCRLAVHGDRAPCFDQRPGEFRPACTRDSNSADEDVRGPKGARAAARGGASGAGLECLAVVGAPHILSAAAAGPARQPQAWPSPAKPSQRHRSGSSGVATPAEPPCTPAHVSVLLRTCGGGSARFVAGGPPSLPPRAADDPVESSQPSGRRVLCSVLRRRRRRRWLRRN